MAGGERADAKRPHNSLEEEERRSGGLINNIQVFRREKDDFDRRMEDLGVWGYKRGQLVTSELKELRGILESLEGKLRRIDLRWKTRGGGPPLSRNDSDWWRNQD